MKTPEPSPLDNSLLGAFVEGGMELLRPILVGIIAFGLGVAGLAIYEAKEQARRWSQVSKWRREREAREAQERKAAK